MVAPLVLIEQEQSEHDLQIACSKMLAIVLHPDVAWTAIDHAHSLDRRIGRNGKPIGVLEMIKRGARGVRPGITDYKFWRDGRGYAIELKRNARESLSDDQKDWIRDLLRAGVPVKVCWSKDMVFRTVENWGLTRTVKWAA